MNYCALARIRGAMILEFCSLEKAGNSGKTIKSSIEGQYPIDPVLFHDGQMQGLPRRQVLAAKNNFLGALRSNEIHVQHLIDNSEQGVKRRLDRVPAVNGDIAVKNLLQYVGVRNQPLPFADKSFQQLLRIALVTMSRTDEIHWNIRINQDHSWIPLP